MLHTDKIKYDFRLFDFLNKIILEVDNQKLWQ